MPENNAVDWIQELSASLEIDWESKRVYQESATSRWISFASNAVGFPFECI